MSEEKNFDDLDPILYDEPNRKSEALPLAQIIESSGLQPQEINPLITEVFTDKNFIEAMPTTLREDVEQVAKYFRNTNLFANLRKNDINLFGEVITHEPIPMANGRTRMEEQGEEMKIEALSEAGIDPHYVLYFRRTQPSEAGTSKPEYYWTSDYWEVVRGLTREISGTSRLTSKILCTSLAELASDSKLTLDINDDNGFPVRRVSKDGYDQSRALFVIEP
jgi:hypothetical protein